MRARAVVARVVAEFRVQSSELVVAVARVEAVARVLKVTGAEGTIFANRRQRRSVQHRTLSRQPLAACCCSRSPAKAPARGRAADGERPRANWAVTYGDAGDEDGGQGQPQL